MLVLVINNVGSNLAKLSSKATFLLKNLSAQASYSLSDPLRAITILRAHCLDKTLCHCSTSFHKIELIGYWAINTAQHQSELIVELLWVRPVAWKGQHWTIQILGDFFLKLLSFPSSNYINPNPLRLMLFHVYDLPQIGLDLLQWDACRDWGVPFRSGPHCQSIDIMRTLSLNNSSLTPTLLGEPHQLFLKVRHGA